MPTANSPTINAARIQSPSVLDERFVTSRAWGLMYNGLIGSVNGLISFLRAYISIFWKSSQTFRIQPLRPPRGARLLAAASVLLSAPVHCSKGWSRRDCGRSASAGPRERRDMGFRRTRRSDPHCVERPCSRPDYRGGRLTNGSALDAGPTGPCLGGGRRGADPDLSVNQQPFAGGGKWQD